MISIKKNFLYTTLLTVANYIFPLIVYPYVSRVLGVANIGLCNFIDSIINYFIMFSMLGISIVGVREIAVAKRTQSELNITFSSIFTLNMIATVVALIILLVATAYVDQLRANSQMMYIGAIKLISNIFVLEWFYKGLEKFRFITLQTIFVRLLYVVSVFLFVRTKEDVFIYFFLTSLIIVFSAVINSIYGRKFVKFTLKDGLQIRRFMGPIFIMGLYFFLTSMYTTFNVAYLGFATDDVQVGYYATANKLFVILLALYLNFTGVMVPRLSALVASNQMDEFSDKLRKSLDILIAFSMPIIVIVFVFAPEIVFLLSGAGYEGAIVPIRIIIPLILIVGYEQILVIQTLMPLKRDKTIFCNSSVGAVVGVILNILLVGKLAAIGSAIVWVMCEICIMILSQIAVSNILNMHFPYFKIVKAVLCYMPLALVVPLVRLLSCNFMVVLILGGIITMCYFLCVNLWAYPNGLVRDVIVKFLSDKFVRK